MKPRRQRARRSGSPTRPLGEVLGFLQLLWAIAHELESISKRMRGTVGVTSPQRPVVRLIGRLGSAAPGDLADILHVHPSSLTGVLRRLERARLVRRTADPGDRRRAILTLTTEGQKLNDDDTGTAEAAVRRTLRHVAPAKAAIIGEVLGALASELAVEAGRTATPSAGTRAPRSDGRSNRARTRRRR